MNRGSSPLPTSSCISNALGGEVMIVEFPKVYRYKNVIAENAAFHGTTMESAQACKDTCSIASSIIDSSSSQRWLPFLGSERYGHSTRVKFS